MRCLQCHAGPRDHRVGVRRKRGFAVRTQHGRRVTRRVRHGSLLGAHQERIVLCADCAEVYAPAEAARTQ